MPRFSKKANLVKELESVIQVRTLKAYLRFYLDAEDIASYFEVADHTGEFSASIRSSSLF